MVPETVLFICSFNSVRSRIAEGLLAARCDGRYTVYSAGIAPAPLNQNAVAVMREIGIDIPPRQPTSVAALRTMAFDYVVTLSDHVLGSNIPLPKGRKTFHCNFTSPCEVRENRDEILADFRRLRDRIDAYLLEIFPAYPPLQKAVPAGDDPAQRQAAPSGSRRGSRPAGDRL